MLKQAAAIYFKNTIHHGVFQKNGIVNSFENSAWYMMEAGLRGQAKAALLGKLADNLDRPQLKNICTCISAMAAVEVPSNNWNDFVDVMS